MLLLLISFEVLKTLFLFLTFVHHFVASCRSPPLALQPSLGHYYAQVNNEWRKGYEAQISRAGRYLSGPSLSNVVVVSISGGYNDYQVSSFFPLNNTL